ncbi:hypothetical protein LIER_02843 [Lithospermum erythrorhizon]|uniref:Uncharacterized protein n=1 Tax=Lithospermum erythrorhizon TaxID=34254 RepID=A0AAV3NRE2_LITER
MTELCPISLCNIVAQIMEYMVSAMWFLWKERNNIIFQDKKGTFEQIWEAGVRLVGDYAAAHSKPVILHGKNQSLG